MRVVVTLFPNSDKKEMWEDRAGIRRGNGDQIPLHDPGTVSLTASKRAILLGRSLALPESRKAV